jgi:hypothetical protein
LENGMKIPRLLGSAMGLLALCAVTHAQANLLANGSFESPASTGAPSLPLGSTALDNWVVTSAEIAQICAGCFSLTASDGSYFLDLAGYHDAVPYGGVQQSFSTVAAGSYSISFDVGARNGTSRVSVSAGSLTATGESTGVGLTWTRYTSTFTATGPTTTVTLTGLLASEGGTLIGLDNVVVVAVPEPTPVLMLGVGAAVLLLSRRARRTAHRSSGS